MARINIEDSIYRDDRFHKLSAGVGKYKAIGLLVVAWDMAHRFFLKHPENLIPLKEWCGQPELEILEAYKLAERRETGIYVKGSAEQCSYLLERQKAGMAGGLARNGGKRREENEKKKRIKASNQVNLAIKRGDLTRPDVCEMCGEFGKIEGHHENYDKPLDVTWLCRDCHSRNHSSFSEAKEAKEAKEPSSSSSPPSKLKKESVSCPTVPTRLEKIFEGFPKRLGDRKKFKAIEYLKKLSEDQITLVEKSVKNYASWMTSNAPSDKRMIPMMVSWLNSRSWEEWIDPVAANPLTTPKKLNLEDL